ncbi:MAG: helix-turn-helix domain-containing protein [Pseudomonadota bacterium]
METSSIAGARHRLIIRAKESGASRSATSAALPTAQDSACAFKDAHAVSLCDALIGLLSETLDVPTQQLRARTRCSPSIARARQIGMYLAHVSLGLKMAEVATGFARHKSTVVHACHMIEDMRDDGDFDAFIARHERIIRVILEGTWDASVGN